MTYKEATAQWAENKAVLIKFTEYLIVYALLFAVYKEAGIFTSISLCLIYLFYRPNYGDTWVKVDQTPK